MQIKFIIIDFPVLNISKYSCFLICVVIFWEITEMSNKFKLKVKSIELVIDELEAKIIKFKYFDNTLLFQN